MAHNALFCAIFVYACVGSLASPCDPGGSVWKECAPSSCIPTKDEPTGATCGGRISWLESPAGGSKSESAARQKIASEYPNECGSCAVPSPGPASCDPGGSVWDTCAPSSCIPTKDEPKGATCGGRINWLESAAGGSKSLSTAKQEIASDYPSDCGACAAKPPTPSPPTPGVAPCDPGGSVWNACAPSSCSPTKDQPNGATCGGRITWLESKAGGSTAALEAKNEVATEYPDACGACHATAAPTPPTPAPKPPTPAPTHKGDTNPPTASKKSFWVISDVHMDPLYNSADSFYHCCSDAHNNACPGPFGKFGCDPPKALLESVLAEAKAIDPDPEFVLFNGDLSGHHLGSSDLTLQTISDAYKMMTAAFPGKLIIPVIGNCETFPDYHIACGGDQQQYGISLSQLYDAWAPSLQGDQRAGPFQAGGYFYVHPSPGIRIIVLNTILYSLRATHSSEDDPCGQFDWLEAQLKLAKERDETVYLVSHVVPGVVSWENSNTAFQSQFSPFWVEKFWTRYRSIIVKHESTIQVHLFGHAHADYFRLLGDKAFGGKLPSKDQVKIAMQELPAVSPVRFNNPAFRRYFRATTKPYEWLTYEQYYLDLDEANRGKPTWRLEYDFAKQYGQHSLSAASFADVYNKIQTDSKLYKQWFNHRHSLSTDIKTIGDRAKFLYTCSMTQIATDDYSTCTKANAPSTLDDFARLYDFSNRSVSGATAVQSQSYIAKTSNLLVDNTQS